MGFRPTRKVKVALHGQPGSATINPNATEGAVLGVNLRNEDGSLVTLEQLGATSSDSTPDSPTTTDSVPEGSSNLYYTDVRADARIAAAMPAIMARQMVGF